MAKVVSDAALAKYEECFTETAYQKNISDTIFDNAWGAGNLIKFGSESQVKTLVLIIFGLATNFLVKIIYLPHRASLSQ